MIIMVGGAKGGVGKSLVSIVTANMLLNDGKNPVIVETDTDNPDVLKVFKGKKHNDVDIDIVAYNIDKDKGWEGFLTTLKNSDDTGRDVVINSAARNTATIMERGETLNAFNDVVTLWVTNDELDGIISLNQYLKVVSHRICIIKNGYFADEAEYSALDNSKMVQERKAQSVYFPKFTNTLRDAIYIKRMAIHELNDNFTYGEMILATSKINKATAAIQEALKIATKI